MIILPLKNLDREGVRLQGSVHCSKMMLESEPHAAFSSPISYDLSARPVSGGVVVKGTVSTVMDCQCGRCLRRYQHRVDLRNVCHFYEKSAKEEIDLTPDIREDIIIALPQNFICGEGCKGLCTICGGDRNLKSCKCKAENKPDAAWQALDVLFKKKK